jgi:hypothetical protein
MDAPLSYRMLSAIKLGALLTLSLCLAPVVGGQELVTDIPAPPPLKFVSRDEQAQLSAARDPKERTGTSIELAEGHLRHAENSTFTRSYDPASAELGRYQAIIEDALRYLVGMNTDSKKVRDLFKRLEMTLRTHIPRLEAIRRDTPFDYAGNVKSVLEYARNARTQALDTFFSDTVVHEDLQDKNQPSKDEHSKDSPPGTQKKQL